MEEANEPKDLDKKYLLRNLLEICFLIFCQDVFLREANGPKKIASYFYVISFRGGHKSTRIDLWPPSYVLSMQRQGTTTLSCETLCENRSWTNRNSSVQNRCRTRSHSDTAARHHSHTIQVYAPVVCHLLIVALGNVHAHV